jgi:hypothetical protein
LGDVENVMFQVVAWPCELINCLLDALKCDLSLIKRAMFQVVPWNLRNNFLLLDGR